MEPYTSSSSNSSLPHKPRVVIIGAGLCGVSAAHHLLTSSPPNSFHVTILEASTRIGGRILSSTLSGQRVELGATWIHGIEGSPIHEIAMRVGAIQGPGERYDDTKHCHDDDGGGGGDNIVDRHSIPWECMDGLSNDDDQMVVSQGGVRVAPSLVRSIGHLYQNLFSLIQLTQGAGLQQFINLQPHSFHLPPQTFVELKEKLILELKEEASVGAYLEQGLRQYLSWKKNEGTEANVCTKTDLNSNLEDFVTGNSTCPCTTQDENLAVGVFRMRENVERSVTGVDSLYDLNLAANEEYREYPGEHVTISKGYSSIVDSLAAELPHGTIHFGKRVQRIDWLIPNSAHVVQVHCDDESMIEADHVIITISLGVLKAEALTTNDGDKQKRSLFQPPLPQWKQHAISKLGFGLVDKCFVAMEKPPNSTYPHIQFIWEENTKGSCASKEGRNDALVPRWMRRNFSFYPIHTTSNVLCMWLTGRDALEVESLSDEQVIDGVLKTMEYFNYKEECEGDGATRCPRVEGILRGRWGGDPLFRGSYSYVAVGSSGHDIDILAEPLPRGSCVGTNTNTSSSIGSGSSTPPLQLLFGGEATHRQCYSTTHGAFLSGMREAQRLMEHYGLLKDASKYEAF